jgi:hypothetical protein
MPNCCSVPHVFCVANYFVNHGGGVEQVAHALATRLNELPHWQVVLVAHADSSLPAPSDLPYALRGGVVALL